MTSKTPSQNIDLSYKPAGKFEETRFEKIHNIIVPNSVTGSICIAQEIADLIKMKASSQEICVLGLATGSSPIKVYEELVRMHKEEGLSFKNVVSFNLDEYYPMEKENPQSYWYFMHEHLFNHVDILPENINIPSGTVANDSIHQFCVDYEMKIKEAGGLDFQLLGIGRTGHIGFNEPGSHLNSGTRNITLDHITRVDATPAFLDIENVPKVAITMGISTIRKAKRIVLMAWGINKAAIIKKTIEGEISSEIPATYLQLHDNVTFVLDDGASDELTRIKTPWLVKSCVWTDQLVKKAVVWLSVSLNKSVLKLTDKDYNNNGMASLLVEQGSAYLLNINMFNKLQHTITGWPGGKPNADDSSRPERAIPAKKRIIVFSPHPNDDTIGMGGTIERLVEQGHEVHIAYQTTGSNGVSPQDALKYAEVIKDMVPSHKDIDHTINAINSQKQDFEETIEVRKLKGMIRKRESLAAMRYLGVSDEQVHFLNLPFYETGSIKKNPVTPKDINITKGLIDSIKPHQVYASGDISDPHGTYKVCIDIVISALQELKSQPYMKDCWMWLYRGAWHEWDIHQIDMAVPMSPDQVLTKRNAIFFHQSQKDSVMYQGDDNREFWLRAEERNHESARKYHDLGFADYAALEIFKRHMY